MNKYEVYKESHIEAPKGKSSWTVEDMINYNNRRTSLYPELLKAFDNKEEAKNYYDNLKNDCQSYYADGSSIKVVLFDCIELRKTEYDDDDENDIIQSDLFESYIAPVDEEIKKAKEEVVKKLDCYISENDIDELVWAAEKSGELTETIVGDNYLVWYTNLYNEGEKQDDVAFNLTKNRFCTEKEIKDIANSVFDI